ncbi:MAG: ATP-binding protein, partial [Bacilli bacterium]|nr:ATP-binding protein [Bacilli bacterium]
MATKDDEYRQSIKDYEQNIVTMKNFIEACRNNPAHIIGYEKDPRAHLSCFREVLQNGIDEIIRPYSPANYVSVEYYEKDGQYVVFDDGRGLPRSSMIRVFTQEYTSSNYNKLNKSNKYKIAVSGKNGIGSKACNSLSEYFEVICYICDKYSESGKPEAYTIRFEKGYPTTKAPIDYPNPNNIQGTRIEFKLDEDIVGNIKPSCEDIVNLVNTIVHLAPLGAVCDIHIEPSKGRNYDVHIVNNGGV